MTGHVNLLFIQIEQRNFGVSQNNTKFRTFFLYFSVDMETIEHIFSLSEILKKKLFL
ncbi:Protein CBG25811 [Caenorhabditis briggsae]|uniref:Protein CBG25811 n=1 Tax=Caenorhabditis briggsae TaxID=6238 RepID=B6IJV4_CAEBR|nr:Protein CBG25811 [Caenorhabditis briggsae]CAS00184.1 Protein CBG25811 [Caenorhabditis briggsae]